MYTDGACRGNPGLAGVGVAFMAEADSHLWYGFKHFVGILTNNQAEYMALIHGLLWLKQHRKQYVDGFEGMDIFSDSRMMVMQILEHHKVRNEKLAPLYRVVRQCLDELPDWTITHVPRSENKIADALAAESLQPYLQCASS